MTPSALAIENISDVPAVIGHPAVADVLAVVDVEGTIVPQT